MRKLALVFILFLPAAIWLAGSALAANDAPHNANNNISCGSCHSDTLLSSPFWGTPDDETYNNFCMLNCHNAPFAPYTDTSAPRVLAHSSTNTSETYGVWSINCVECHDPHIQRQKLWKGTSAAELFLATGITALPIPVYDAPSNTSIINYDSLNLKEGWDVEALTNKSLSERRALLFPNLSKLGFSYNVIEIDNPAGTITVEGDASEGFAYVSPPTSFAVTYGQYLRQTIEVNGTLTPVKMFGNTGNYSFAYDESESGTDPTPTGICQICHLNTTHWNKDGSGAAVGIHAQFNGGNCTKCHRHDQGFKNIYVDHSAAGLGYVLEVASCVSCHTGPEPVIDIHLKNCAYCHQADMSLQDGLTAGDCANCHAAYALNFENGHQNESHVELTGVTNCTTTCHGGDLLSVVHGGTCTKCHTNTTTDGSLKAGGNGDATTHALGVSSSCADCHPSYNTSFQAAHEVKDHTGISGSANCTTTCHPQTTAADIASLTHAANGCTNCHTDATSNGTLKNAANGNAAAGAGSCVFCHGAYNTNFTTGHQVKDHDGVTAAANCATNCHSGNIIASVHADNCTSCHTNAIADGTLKAGANGYGDASGGAGACADCHPAYQADFLSHAVGDHSGVIANQAPFIGIKNNCASCHTGDLITATANGSNPGTHQNVCTTCHLNTSTDGSLKDGANDYGDASGHLAGSASDCDACHQADGYFDSHLHLHTVSEEAGDLSQEMGLACSTCHDTSGGGLATWQDILVEHENRCANCHDASRDTSKSTTYSIGETIQTVIAANAATTCASCHRDKIDSIATDASHGIDHLGQGKVTGAAQCTGCHDQAGNNSNTQFIYTIHGSCGKCHDDSSGGGPLKDFSGGGSGIGEEINYRTINGGDGGSCATCHAAYAANFESGHKNESHAELTVSANCATTCHTGSMIASVHTETCTNCHTNTTTDGRLKVGASLYGDATGHVLGGPSTCAACHSGYNTNFSSHAVGDHSGLIANAAPAGIRDACAGCHSGDLITAVLSGTNPGTHQNVCTNCHTNTVANGTLIDGGNNYGDASAHVIGIASDCDSCHSADGYFDTHTHTHTVSQAAGDISQERALACASCHDPNTNSLAGWVDILALHQNGCGLCHDATRDTSKSTTYTIGETVQDVIAANASPTTCASCHRDKIDTISADAIHGIDHKAAGKVTGADQCTSCHDQDGNDNNIQYLNTIHGSCDTCHLVARGGGPLRDFSGGGASIGEAISYEAINGGAGGSCAICHASYAASFENGHKNEDHARVTATTHATPTLNCGGCHSGDIITGAQNHNSDCTNCHINTTTDGSFTAGPLGTALTHTIGADSECADCHNAAYFINHSHSHTVSQGAGDLSQELAKPCADCHDDNNNSLALWADILVEHVSDCTVCHDASRNTSKSGTYSSGQTIQTVIAANADPTNCEACHRDKIDAISAESIHGHDHKGQGKVTGETQCMGCHDPAGNDNNIQFLNVIHTTCGKCHVAGRGAGPLHNYAGSGGTIAQFTNYETLNNGAGGACNECHAATFPLQHGTVSHASLVSLATDCSGCHAGTEGLAGGMVVNAADNKVHDSCAQCHGTTGVLVGSAAGKSGANSCHDCHGDFVTVHADADHETSVALATDCSLCHAGTEGTPTGMPISAGDPKKHDSCAACHGTTGALVGIAIGHSAPNDCEDCHGAYFPSHQNPDAHHDHRTIGYGTLSNPCAKCHKSDTTLGRGVPGAGAMAGQSDIDSLHGRATNACNLCHFYNVATQANDEGLPLAATVANAIINGMDDDTPVDASCMTCHSYNEDPAIHGGHLVPDRITTKVATCTVCHDRDPANPLLVVDDIHKLTCANCHSTPQPPTLLDPASKANADQIVKGDCADCHGAYDHDNDIHAKISYGDDGAGNLNCLGCHVADPITEHMDIRGWECAVCHRNPCFDTVINDAINGVTSTVYCTDCHTDRDFPHGMIDHVALGKVSEELLCAVCHNPANSLDWLVDIHGDGVEADCALCHLNPAGAGPLLAVLEGDASAVDGGICSECHNASLTLPNIGAFHGLSASDPETINRHNNLAGATGEAAILTNPNIIVARETYKCNDCHLARTVEERLNEHPGCVICHNGLAAFETVITAGKASGGNTVQACEACHNSAINGGGETNSPSGQAMYQYDGLRHHALEYAQKGRCDYCHADPRPDWSVTYGATLPEPLPTQLACVFCHQDTSANGVLIKKNTYEPSAVYFPSATGWNLSAVASVQQATKHTITGSAPIAITNYGACLFCHTVNIWHAKPAWDKDVNDSKSGNKDDTFDVLRQAPGRSWWPSKPSAADNDPTDNGGIARFDIFSSAANTGGATKTRMYGRYNFGSSSKPYENSGSENRGDKLYKSFKNTNPWLNTLANAPLGFSRLTVPRITAINDAEGLMSSDPMVPIFTAITPPAVTGQDKVTIIDAGWNDGNNNRLEVMAVNRQDDAVTLSVTYGSQLTSAPMTWDAALGAWTYTSAATVLFDGSEVVVSSDHAGGGSDTIAPRDMTVNASEAGVSSTAQTHIDNAANNIPADVLAAGACTDCHLGNLALEHAKHGRSCSTCHAPCAVPPTPLATVTCYSCHDAREADHPADAMPSHYFLKSAPAKCVGCHDQAEVAAAIHSACDSCHDAAFDLNNLQSGANGNARLHVLQTNSECTVCHPARNLDFTGGHQNEDHNTLIGSAQCVSCHSGAELIADVHGDNCNLCHRDSTTDGSLIGSAAGHGIGVNSGCADCHSAHAADFVAGHQNEDHAKVVASASATPTENCLGCHPGNVISAAALHNNICEKCHTNQSTDGSLRAGPRGDATNHLFNTESGCADCHSAYFAGHTHVHTIIELDGDTDLAQADSQPCNNCHNDNSNNLATWADILVEHRSLCSTCHNAVRLTGNPGAPAETVQEVIAAKTNPTNCLSCHWNKAAPAVHDIDHPTQGRVTGSAQCISCHDKDQISTNAWYIETIHDMATNGCGLCHVAATGGGPLVAPYETNFPAGGACADCHAAYATNFVTGHQNADHSGLGSTAVCTGCHNGDLITSANTHNGSCTRCHTNTTTDGSLHAGSNGSAAGHYLGATSTCADCHGGYATDFENSHAVGDHSGIAGTASCQGCHNGDVITGANVHDNSCTTCHTNLSTNGTLKAAANGDATNHSLSGASSCLTCHADYSPDFAEASAHKVKDHSGLVDPIAPATPTADCTACHDGIDDRPLIEWNDDFTGLATGAAGRATFGNWTGVNGSDGTNPWMVWTGSTASTGTGPSNGYEGSGNYLVIESSTTVPVSATVTRLGSWSTNKANTTGNATLSYPVPTGSNRVLVVTVAAEDAGQVEISGATYGGATLTEVDAAVQGTGYSNQTWIGLCDEACISSASGTTVQAIFVGNHSTGMTIGAATFANVDQTTPVSSHNSVNTSANTISTSVTNPANGKVIYHVEFNGVGANSISPPAGFSEITEFDTTSLGFRSAIGERDSTAAGSVTVNPTNTGTASNRTTIVAIALNPAPGDGDAVNGVNLTANSSHYLESAVIDGSVAKVSFSFAWNMNVGDNADASLHVDVWNGGSWDQDVSGGAIQTGDHADTWMDVGPLDLSAYSNADLKLRLRYEAGTGTSYLNDLALDNLAVIGTPRDLTPGDVHYDECTHCHAANGSGELRTGSRGDAASHVLGVASQCSSCHGAYGYFDSHLHSHDVRQGTGDLAQGNSQPCNNCHGIVSMWSNIFAVHGSACITCHDAARDINPDAPTGTTVQEVIANQSTTVNCLSCHADKTAPAVHGVVDHFGLGKVTWTARCAACHNASGNADVIYDVHKVGTKNRCGTCHLNPYGVGPLREPWETDSPSGGECTTCHGTEVTDQHHAREQAQGGDCTYCHADPRPDWITTYGTMTPSPLAKQLACVKCHVKPDGTGLVVYANSYTPTNVTGFPSGSSALAISGGARVQQTAVHTILGQAKIKVYNYAACLNCHDGNTAGAPQIQVWHAKPTWNKNTHDLGTGVYDNPFDVLRYAPGRSEVNNSGTVIDSKFNIFYNAIDTGTTKARMYGRYYFGTSSTKPYKGTNSQSRGKNRYQVYKSDGANPWYNDLHSQKFQIPCVSQVNDPQSICNGTNPKLPYFDDIAVPVVMDNVLILKAEWDGSDLSVWAYNDYQDSMSLSFNYNGINNTAMSWNDAAGRWEGSLTAAYASTVTVNSSSPGGGTDTENVTDLSAVPDVLYVTKSEWTSDNGGTITIHADHSLNNGSLTYEVTYGASLGEMSWNGVARRYEISKSGIQYLGTALATIASTDPGGDLVEVPVENVSGPPQDVVYATRAVWDGNSDDTLTIYATHKLNTGVLTYKVDYNGFNNNLMTWKPSRYRYELVVEGITFNGGAQARIYSEDGGGDEILVEVTDISGSADHESLGHVSQTADCSKCHNWNANDPKDVVTDIHKGKCTHCHTLWPTLKGGISAGNCEHCHGVDYHAATAPHDQITYGYGGNNCLMSCHQPAPLDEHLTGAVTGRTWECVSCHASPYYIGTINAAVAGSYEVYCTDCHASQTFPHGVRHHQITNLGNCTSCHGSADVVNVIHEARCESCHASVVPAVTNTIAAGGGDCADCHAAAYQHLNIGYHNNSILPSCSDCHDASTFSQTVSTHRDSCATCHASADATVISVIATGGEVNCTMCHVTNGTQATHHANVNATSGNCIYCHSNSLVGPTAPQQMACRECHVESSASGLKVKSYRLSLGNGYTPTSMLNEGGNGTTGIDANGYVTSHAIPHTEAITIGDYEVCMDCHSRDITPTTADRAAPIIAPFHGFGGKVASEMWDDGDGSCNAGSGTNVVTVDCTNRSNIIGGVAAVTDEKTTASNGKRIPLVFVYYHPGHNSFRRFGITTKMTRRNTYTSGGGLVTPGSSNSMLYRSGDGIYPPDTAAWNGNIIEGWLRNYNIFPGGECIQGGGSHLYSSGGLNCADRKNSEDAGLGWETPKSGYNYYVNNSIDIPYTNFGTTEAPAGVGHGNLTNVPYFQAIAAPVVPAVPDDVTITMAHWYELDHDAHTGTLIIQAVNRETDTLRYNAADLTAVDNHWQITLTGVALPAEVTITSTYSEGGEDTLAVTDMSCYDCIQDNTIAHDYIENLVAPGCTECHLTSLPDEHATHGLSCSNCHENPATAVQQAIEVGVYGGVTCDTCHGARTADHPYDLHTHSVHLDEADLGQVDGQSCGNCHQVASWYEIEKTTHKVATNGTGSCNTCHLSNRVEVKDTIKYRTGGTAHCLSCHSLMAAPAAHGNDHPISQGPGDLSQFDSEPCSSCHGALASWKDVYIVHQSNCETCHLATRDINPVTPTGTTVPQVIAAHNPVTCLGCHADKLAPADHGLEHHHIVPGVKDSAYLGTLTCFTAGCHAGSTYTEHMRPGGIAYQKYEDLGTSFECDWCHQYRSIQPGMAAYNDDPVINAAISEGVNNQADVYCSDCHAYSTQRHDRYNLGWSAKYSDSNYRISSRHHNNVSEALTGACSSCHTDLRTDPYGTAESLPTPKKLACLACHVEADPIGGTFGTGQMTVYKTKTATKNDHGSYYSWDWQFEGPIANTKPADQSGMPHQWDVVGGLIDDFGTCLFCHRLGPFHAKPAALPADDLDKDVVDLFNDPPYRQNVGRGLFNAFFASSRQALNYYSGFAQAANQAEYRESRDNESWARESVTWAKVIYDPQTDPKNNVAATHTMLTPEEFIVPTFDAPLGGDTVTITNTIFNSGALELAVTATNTATGQGYELHAIHNGLSVLMTEGPAGTWNGTLTGYPFDISDEIGSVYVISVDPGNNHVTLAQAASNPTPIINNGPALTVTTPSGGGATATQGANYSITYELSDAEEVVTAAFYYDTDNSGLNGIAIAGCATEPEAAGGSCAWDTSGITPGTYYIYAIANDGSNPQVADYSSGAVTIEPPTVTVGGGVAGTYKSSTESWQLALYDLNNPFTAAASGTVVDFTVRVTNPGNFQLFVCAPSGGEGGSCAVNATVNVSTSSTGNVTWSGLSMPINNGEVIGIWHALGDGIGEKTTAGLREQYEMNAAAPTTASSINGTNYGVSLMMEATVEY